MPTFAIPIGRKGVNKKFGAIAQLVEQRTENPCVPGSIPGGTTQKTAIEVVLLRFFVLHICASLPISLSGFHLAPLGLTLASLPELRSIKLQIS